MLHFKEVGGSEKLLIPMTSLMQPDNLACKYKFADHTSKINILEIVLCFVERRLKHAEIYGLTSNESENKMLIKICLLLKYKFRRLQT